MKVLLQNIRSLHNVGSIFRSSDALGVSEIFLGGYTPGPYDRYGDLIKSFSKVSLGSEHTVKYSKVRNLGNFLDQCRTDGVLIIALELDVRSVDYSDFKMTNQQLDNCVLVVGNERRGLSKTILDAANVILKIPMSGSKESLNVSVAFAVAAFALRDRSRKG
jgi:tRNA G18 (ribose-2'-O)-methylase SpoU